MALRVKAAIKARVGPGVAWVSPVKGRKKAHRIGRAGLLGGLDGGQNNHFCTIWTNYFGERALQVISTFLPPQAVDGISPKTVLMLFDTLVDKKRVVVGITVGQVQGPDLRDVRVSPIGQNIINALGRHMDLNYPDSPVIIAGVAQIPGAKERVRKVLAHAPEGSGVLLVCANNKVYDAAFPALCIDYQSANMTQH
ncbi:hypothetical protein IB233_02125 [Comamonas sp. CMM01]|uniref:hypothetical protein n=1 Tax=Comamonas sp. CMM01 TaxID=2769280 RepID=UPI0017858C2E|nr:hypothetical protein [Comamonas sp. CMM01]MBD9530429.1 hypothetical protein [Comamonas sp. CMM01]